MRETNGGGASAADAGEWAGGALARNGDAEGALQISEHTAAIDGNPVFWRSAPCPGDRPVPLYLHGVPSSADDWGTPARPREEPRRKPRRVRRALRRLVPPFAERERPPHDSGLPAVSFLARSGGLAPDLPGFGRSGKPGSLSYTIDEYEHFIERFLELVEVEQVQLVVHDWGAVGLAFAQRHPERVRALVVINAVPLFEDYRWHRVARIWRTPGLGELAMGATTRGVLSLITRESNVAPGPMPAAWREGVFEHLDQGTQRAILRLYRSSPSEVLGAAGAGLSKLSAPALVVWGARDPYIPARFAEEYARTLPNAELELFEDAGHWPWLDRPDVIDRVCSFLAAN